MENSKPKNIYEILAHMAEELSDPICLMCPDHRSTSKREICKKYEEEILAYLKTQGIEKV